MKTGSALGKGIDQLSFWMRQLQQPVKPVDRVVPKDQEQRVQHPRTAAMRGRDLDGFLYGSDFKARYEAAVTGTSPRAAQARDVQQRFSAYHHDSFQPFKRAPVALK
jgi:hypothetical protein